MRQRPTPDFADKELNAEKPEKKSSLLFLPTAV